MNWLQAFWRFIHHRRAKDTMAFYPWEFRDEAERAALIEEAMREIYLYRGLT